MNRFLFLILGILIGVIGFYALQTPCHEKALCLLEKTNTELSLLRWGEGEMPTDAEIVEWIEGCDL